MNCSGSRSSVRSRRTLPLLAVALFSLAAQAVAQTVVTRGSEMTLDVSTARNEIVFDLLGDLWVVPASGGVATRLVETNGDAKQPRWSPEASRVVFEQRAGTRASIGLFDTVAGTHRILTETGHDERDPAWHPSGERLVFSARRRQGGFDLWEVDLETGLEWRLTDDFGNELDAAWSADGRDLVYVSQTPQGWALMLREFARPPRALLRSESPLAAPSWRPDGTLIAYFKEREGQQDLRMLILSDPPLDRVISENNGLYPDAVSWLDRNRLYYSGNESMRTREFNDWIGKGLAFRAAIAPAPAEPADPATPPFIVASRSLAAIDAPADKLVVRADRMFDGQSGRYRSDVDVLIEGGVITDVTASRDWENLPVINLPGTTMLPGLIDVNAAAPSADLVDGAALLAWGVTTVVARDPESLDAARWHSDEHPGPRLLPAATLAEDIPDDPADGPFLVLASASGPGTADSAALDRVNEWQALGVPVVATDWKTARALDTFMLPAAEPASNSDASTPPEPSDIARRRLLSSLADRHTPGISELLEARQLEGLAVQPPPVTRIPLFNDLRRSRTPLIVSSAANGLPPGLALHAEFLAMQAAGLSGEAILKAAGREAANALGLGGLLGEITVGAMADMVLVRGDPLDDINDARNVVGVVRNGRFYSLVSLLERNTPTVGKFDNNEIGGSVRQSLSTSAMKIGR